MLEITLGHRKLSDCCLSSRNKKVSFRGGNEQLFQNRPIMHWIYCQVLYICSLKSRMVTNTFYANECQDILEDVRPKGIFERTYVLFKEETSFPALNSDALNKSTSYLLFLLNPLEAAHWQ